MERYLPYVALALAVATFVHTHMRTRWASDVESKLNVLGTKVDLFWSIVEKHMGTMLHSPHRENLDRLIDKNLDCGESFTRDDAEEMSSLLHRIMDEEDLKAGDRAAAIMLIATLEAKYLGAHEA